MVKAKERKFIPVESSVIKAIRWTPGSLKHGEKIGFLDVMFVLSGSVWRYSDVHRDVFNEFLVSYSKGKYYCDNIKGSFPSEKFPNWELEKIVVGEPDEIDKPNRTVEDIVKLTKECLIRQINDIEAVSVISEIDGESFPALTDFEKTFINAAFDKIKSDILDSINID
jgi:hypothetical protein